MSNEELDPDCGRIRSELPAFLYGELASEATAAIERHVAGCSACSDELSGLRETRRLLARWETPPASDDPRQLARAIAEQARQAKHLRPRSLRPRLLRWSAVLSGAAAAILFTLGVLNTQVDLGDGRLQISFGLPGSRPAALHPDLDQRIETIATQVVAAQSAGLQRDQEELVQRCSQMSREEMQQELLRLSRAFDVALAEKERTFDSRLNTLGRDAAIAVRQQGKAIADLAAFVVPASNPR